MTPPPDADGRDLTAMWTDRLITALLVVVGAVNLLPGYVALAPARMDTAYGVSTDGPDSADLTMLLRHRAVLLALVGVGLLVAAFLPALRPAAITAAAVSMGSFLLFAYTTADLGAATVRVARIDIAALALLAVAAALVVRRRRA
ncbi:phosphopantetheine adenylyltransferase [Streptomyces bohaiensis]|uniref:Phosphopantetheine adenylyltransferase n=1 Tax=Streptomyces bohaiensis TaxID=1431344 RepID=A0ABX1CLF8_9ACTN|nr:phosphopantetheine adenylyltransferase [Streptomyces bohaiensis]NJQ17962.1 phosphopantetheine adenylyltransferase [Streptomyces bohaiensis]